MNKIPFTITSESEPNQGCEGQQQCERVTREPTVSDPHRLVDL